MAAATAVASHLTNQGIQGMANQAVQDMVTTKGVFYTPMSTSATPATTPVEIRHARHSRVPSSCRLELTLDVPPLVLDDSTTLSPCHYPSSLSTSTDVVEFRDLDGSSQLANSVSSVATTLSTLSLSPTHIPSTTASQRATVLDVLRKSIP